MAIQLMSEPLLMKRGSKSVLLASTFIPAEGEIICEIDTGQMKVGNGIDTYANLKYVGEFLND